MFYLLRATTCYKCLKSGWMFAAYNFWKCGYLEAKVTLIVSKEITKFFSEIIIINNLKNAI